MNLLYPIFLKLKNKKILIIGGGLIALQKLQGFLNTEAEITVLAPTIINEVKACTGKFPNQRKINFIEREYTYGDEHGYFMLVAATELPELNNTIANRCKDQMILVNSVDDPEACDFYVPSVVEAEDIKIAISTNGKAPALSQRLRKDLEPLIQEKYSPLIKPISEFREKVKKKILGTNKSDQARRSRLVRWFTDRILKTCKK